MDEKIKAAAEEYINRRNRVTNPHGSFDKAGRWYPDDNEMQSCCSRVRGPSRRWPYSYLTHCRTAGHVARLHGVSERELRRAVREIEPPTREGGESYYKAVAQTEDGRLVSIYNGETEYQIGIELHDTPHRGHNGGLYVYASLDEAQRALFPAESKAADLPRVYLRCQADGVYCRYDNKLAFSRITPLEIVSA